MITRDVPLIRAIADLVDNSLDGALRSGKDSYKGFWVQITLSPESFRIQDNCGGIPVEIAKNYAFRFGRPPDAPATEGSIGQFGVGMKRTIFKLGQHFIIRSNTPVSRFVVDGNVKEWLQSADWNFSFEKLEAEAVVPEDEVGTTVEVNNLHESVAKNFALRSFEAELKYELEQAHATAIHRGFAISINGVPLGVREFDLLQSDLLTPAYKRIEIPPAPNRTHGVLIQIYAGLSKERNLEKGGWYVFCNGRQILEADQSVVTGWTASLTEDSQEDGRVPKYHADFAYFRGFVFFESRDASQLPWTTTKTGVDSDSPIYRAARLEMMRIMKPIVKFLRELATEKREEDQGTIQQTPLRDAMQGAQTVAHTAVVQASGFKAPQRERGVRVQGEFVNIQYAKHRDVVERVKERIGATSARQAGEMTFDYFFKAECE